MNHGDLQIQVDYLIHDSDGYYSGSSTFPASWLFLSDDELSKKIKKRKEEERRKTAEEKKQQEKQAHAAKEAKERALLAELKAKYEEEATAEQ